MENKPNTERLGIAELEALFATVGWYFREQFVKDIGVDAQVEIVEKNCSTGNLIAIQVKSGMSYFSETTTEHIIHRPEKRHVEYWLKHCLPVIIVLYNTDEKILYWTDINKNKLEELQRSYKIVIPKKQQLNKKNINNLKKVLDYSKLDHRFNRLLFDVSWMQLVAQNETVYVEYEDWVNKSLSRTSIRIYCDTTDTRHEVFIPTTYCPGLSSYGIVQNFLPWADFETDTEAYYQHMEDVHSSECYGGYDKETGVVIYTESFSDWYKEPEGICPVYSDGEIEGYKLVISLNNIGKSFLTLYDHLYSDNYFEKSKFSINDL